MRAIVKEWGAALRAGKKRHLLLWALLVFVGLWVLQLVLVQFQPGLPDLPFPDLVRIVLSPWVTLPYVLALMGGFFGAWSFQNFVSLRREIRPDFDFVFDRDGGSVLVTPEKKRDFL